MSKLKELKSELDVLVEIEKTARMSREELINEKTIEIGEMTNKYFSGCLIEGDDIISNTESFEIRRDHPELSYKKDVMTVYFRNKSWEDRSCDKLETSFYSTSTNDDFELNRMILIGKIGQTILDFRDDIIGEYNLIQDKWKKKMGDSISRIYESERNVREKRNEIANLERLKLECDVENGIVFNDSQGINIQVGFDNFRKRVKKIQKVGETLSGKSVKLEMTLEYEQWNSGNDKWEIVNYDKGETLVRRNYFNEFLYEISKLEDGYKVVNI